MTNFQSKKSCRNHDPLSRHYFNENCAKLMTTRMASRYLSIGNKTLRNWGPEPIRLGRRLFYSKDALDYWLRSVSGFSSNSAENIAKEIEERFFAGRARRDA